MASTLGRALSKTGRAGEPLPVVFPKWAEAGIIPRRGQVTMIAAAPGVGKSILAQKLSFEMREPTLYISADSDEFTMGLRAASLATGHMQTIIEDAMSDEYGNNYYIQIINRQDWIRYVFEPSPTVEDIVAEVEAFVALWGNPPNLIVVDNLINVDALSNDEWTALRDTTKDLHALARDTGAGIILLHHVTGEYEGGQTCPPRKALMGKVSQLPELILTLCRSGERMGVACVKNRLGPNDPTARYPLWLVSHPENMMITDSLDVLAKTWEAA